MMMLLDAILSALVPVGIDGVKQLITKFTGGVRPTTVAEQIQLDQNEIQKLQALAALDNPGGTPSQWVVDLRGSSRYIGALVVIFLGVFTIYTDVDESVKTIGLEAANIAFGFLFGSRIMANLQVKK
jgi:uncharacterized membrane protein